MECKRKKNRKVSFFLRTSILAESALAHVAERGEGGGGDDKVKSCLFLPLLDHKKAESSSVEGRMPTSEGRTAQVT